MAGIEQSFKTGFSRTISNRDLDIVRSEAGGPDFSFEPGGIEPPAVQRRGRGQAGPVLGEKGADRICLLRRPGASDYLPRYLELTRLG